MPGHRASGAAWLAFAVVGTLPLFWFGLVGLADAWARPEFSHGPVIPILSFYMFLREMKAVPPPAAPVTDRWPGVGVILFALALAAIGNLVRIDHLVFYALIVWVAGLVLVCFGFSRGRVFWPSVLHLVFMLPLPQFLYWKVNTTLQLVSSVIGVKLVALAGVPVYLEGNVIDLGVTMLQVAEACSGLRYLFPIMSFTYVFAVLYRGPLWQKLVLLALAVPVAVMMNAVRIGIIGILVDRYGVAQAEGFLHVFEGWVVFLSCLAILFGLAKAMQRIVGDRRPLGEALDLDFSGLGAQIARIRFLPPSPALVTAALMTAALGLAWSLVPAPEAAPPPREPYALFPQELGGWSGSSQTLEPGDRAHPRRRRLSRGPLQPAGRGRAGRPVPLLLRQPDRGRPDPLARGLPARRRLGGVPHRARHGRAARHPDRRCPAEPGGDPEGARAPARLLLVSGAGPAVHRRLRRPVRQHHRQPHPRAHRRRPGAGDHGDRRRRRRRRRRPPAALPRGQRRPAPPLHPRIDPEAP